MTLYRAAYQAGQRQRRLTFVQPDNRTIARAFALRMRLPRETLVEVRAVRPLRRPLLDLVP